MLRKLIILATLLSFLTLALGFGGRFHPLGDSLAVFRLPNLAVSALLLYALRKPKVSKTGLALLALSAASMAFHYIPQSVKTDDALRLYQKNLLFYVQDRTELKADILRADPDFITLQEVQRGQAKHSNLVFIAALKPSFPHQFNCPNARVRGLSLLSRWPITQTYCSEGDGIGAIQVQSPKGPLWIISVHLHWPYPHKQSAQVKRVIKHIESLKGPKILAGDFNMVPWSHTVKALERASGTKPARPVIHSFDLPKIGLRIPIDHVLLPRGAKGKTQRRGKLGSDHYGVLATFNLAEP